MADFALFFSKGLANFSFTSLTSMAAYTATMLLAVLLAFKLAETTPAGVASPRSGWTNLFRLSPRDRCGLDPWRFLGAFQLHRR